MNGYSREKEERITENKNGKTCANETAVRKHFQ